MINIPTELLRTFVAVVDMRSFTKAAQVLNVTQPAVSAQIKRLQLLLGTELLDKSAPGVMLTPLGELVVNYARRLLSLNDQILRLSEPTPLAQSVRIGVPGDFVGPLLPWILTEFRARWPDVRFHVQCGGTELLFKGVHKGEIDLLVHLSQTRPENARHSWAEEAAWVRGPAIRLEPGAPVPLVTYGPSCAYHRLAVEALTRAELAYDIVFSASSIATLAAAITAGLGVMAITRSRVRPSEMVVWEEGPLPKLPDLYCGIYVSDGGDQDALGTLADAIATVLRPGQDVQHGKDSGVAVPSLR
jgi:DNA-binding transcriptional LysR family regulator